MKSTKQPSRKNVFEYAITNQWTNRQIATELGVTTRQVQYIKVSYRLKGDDVFVHGNTGKKSSRAFTEDFKKQIYDIRMTQRDGDYIFKFVNYTHFRDILEEDYGIKISKSSVRNILLEFGVPSAKKRRVTKSHPMHYRRECRESEGELVQADGTPHDWFGTGVKYCIQGFVDDARSIPLGLYMTKNECTFGYAEAARYMCINHGIPQQVYSDLGGVFHPTRDQTLEEQLTDTKPKTQFAKQMDALGIEMIKAYSPQAKGRIERFWGTLQGRLVTEFKMHNIKTMEAANEYLPIFMKKYERWFGKEPKVKESSFSKMIDPSILEKIFTVKINRKTDASGVISIKGYTFQVDGCYKKNVLVHLSHKNGIYAEDEKGHEHKVSLLEAKGKNMPIVWQELINEYLLKDSKHNYREAC